MRKKTNITTANITVTTSAATIIPASFPSLSLSLGGRGAAVISSVGTRKNVQSGSYLIKIYIQKYNH